MFKFKIKKKSVKLNPKTDKKDMWEVFMYHQIYA